jgi:hypothetical protein
MILQSDRDGRNYGFLRPINAYESKLPPNKITVITISDICIPAIKDLLPLRIEPRMSPLEMGQIMTQLVSHGPLVSTGMMKV